MADKQDKLDFSDLQATTVERLKARKIVPVPPVLVSLAQDSYDEEKVKEINFESVERALKFADLMKHAGDHTTPLTSVTVIVNPDKEAGNDQPTLVRYRAGNRRGRSV
jgi:hypothetical protein